MYGRIAHGTRTGQGLLENSASRTRCTAGTKMHNNNTE